VIQKEVPLKYAITNANAIVKSVSLREIPKKRASWIPWPGTPSAYLYGQLISTGSLYKIRTTQANPIRSPERPHQRGSEARHPP